jgi:hypothetical protein
MKKGQSRGTGNTGHTSRRKNKTKTQHNMRGTLPYASKSKQDICPLTNNCGQRRTEHRLYERNIIKN